VIAARASREVIETMIEATGELDYLISSDTCFELSLDEQRAFRERSVRAAFAWHVAACPVYRRLVVQRGIDPAGVASGEIALDAVPVIPTSAFKRTAIRSVPPDDVVMLSRSSGTRGPVSTVGRDRTSLERLLGSVRAGTSLIHAWDEDEIEMVHLGPDRAEAGEIWFPYVMSLVELLHPTRHRLVGGAFEVDAAIADVRSLLDERAHVGVIGPPFLVAALIQRIAERKQAIRAGDRLTVVTAGGWKRFTGEQIERGEFEARICEVLQLSGAAQVRDAFNQVELNTVCMECRAHRKHVPAWVHATTREPDGFAALPRGEVGLLSFLDASARSYPAFLVTDDVGVVEEGLCGCGRVGTTVAIHRRLTTRAQRGCALAIDRRTAGSEAAP
jgi:long-chain-fatty-acid---luciferin-component ligase